MNRFWNWVRNEDGRTLYLNGTIAEESWFEDEITPAAFKAELMAGEGDITVWINSPGGDCIAASQIYCIGGWLGYFLGGCDGLLYALIAFVVVDYITGVMCAAADKKLSSEVGFKGIAKKVLIFLLVGIANILDVQVIGTGSVLRTAIIFFYISNEGVSLLENAGHLGLPIPEKLREILEQLHDRAENGKEDE